MRVVVHSNGPDGVGLQGTVVPLLRVCLCVNDGGRGPLLEVLVVEGGAFFQTPIEKRLKSPAMIMAMIRLDLLIMSTPPRFPASSIMTS